MTKTIQSSHTDWVDRLREALWAYRTSWRNTTGYTPYELVYGKQVLMPIEFQLKTFRMAAQLGLNLSEAKQQRILQLNEQDETRENALQHTILFQDQSTKWHDKFIRKNSLNKGIGHFFFILGSKTLKVS